MKRRPAAAMCLIGCAILLVGCAATEHSATESSSRSSAVRSSDSVAAPSQTAHYGALEIAITGVDEELLAPSVGNGAAVPGAVFTFHVKNTGADVVSQWATPALTYGAEGVPAPTAMPYAGQGDDSIGQELNGGVVAPGATQTVREGFSVRVDQLTNATVVIGTAVWRGDFTKLAGPSSQTDQANPTTVPTTEVTEPTPAQTTDTPAPQCNDGAVIPGGNGSYSTCQGGQWVSVQPTYDPNSGDGYGPNQPLPPLCVRFPDQYQCPS